MIAADTAARVEGCRRGGDPAVQTDLTANRRVSFRSCKCTVRAGVLVIQCQWSQSADGSQTNVEDGSNRKVKSIAVTAESQAV